MNNLANQCLVRLLLVDDNLSDREICKQALEQYLDCDFKVFEAETGKQGLKLARTEALDCILLEHNLPDMSGIEFLAELAGETNKQTIPVVMLTISDNAMLAVEAIKLGAYDFVVKNMQPEPAQWLPSLILRALREHSAMQEKATAIEELHKAEAKYRTLVEQIPAITYIASLESMGKLIYISPQVQQLGYPSLDWLDAPEGILKWVHTDDQAVAMEAYSQIYKYHTPIRCEYRLVKYDGQARWFQDEAKVVCDGAGNPQFLQGILIDITKDKEAEQELSYYHRRLEELVAHRTGQLEKQNATLNAANRNLAQALDMLKHHEAEMEIAAAAFETQSGIIIADADKHIIRVNQAFTRITGYSSEYALGKSPYFLRSGLHDPAFYEVLWTNVERDGFWEGEIWNKRHNGELFPVWQTITKVIGAEGHISHYVGSFADITAQKKAEKMLSEARARLKKQMACTQEELQQIKAETLELNTALNVLLKHRNQDKSEAQLSLSHQVEETLLPLLKKLKGQSAGRLQTSRIIGILESNLQQLVKSYGNSTHLDAIYRKLSPVETQVVSMVRQGLATKVIAAALNITAGTVESHRKHIRKKLGLDPKVNLHCYLSSLDESD